MSIFEVQTPQNSIGFQFWKLYQHWQKQVSETLSPYHITHTQFVMMASIAWFEEQGIQPSQAQVTQLMNIDKMACSKAVRQLESNGFVKRAKSKTDARAWSLSLNKKGLDIVPQAMKSIAQVDMEVFGSLGERKTTFNKILLLLNKS
ncbi:MAG TPA: MarR family transcriptional regulator [Ghiorsea sp.]|nr:MarR family transcriptional regulator [Ghiorsea sp.]